jgi:V/A-type H+-transporting ATPase subunit C
MLPPNVKIQKSPDFTFAVGKIRFWESKLLPALLFYQLADARDFSQLDSVLSSTSYAKKLTPLDFDNSFDSEEFTTLKELQNFIKDFRFLMPFLYKRDFHNLKLFTKVKFADVEAEWLKESFVDKELAIKAITAQDYDFLSKKYKDFIIRARTSYEKTDNWQTLDAFLDKKLYEQILDITKEFPFANYFFKMEIDLLNIKTFVRCKKNSAEAELFGKLFIDGGLLDKSFFVGAYGEPIDRLAKRLKFGPYDVLTDTEKGLSQNGLEFTEIEKKCSMVLLKYLSSAKYTAFGYEPILRYVFLKKNELKNLRTVFVGKLHKVSSEEIKAKLGPFAY